MFSRLAPCRSDVPVGPGEYHVEKDPGGLAFSVPTGPRGNNFAPKEITAGPGEYETQDRPRDTPAWTFAGKKGPQVRVSINALLSGQCMVPTNIVACTGRSLKFTHHCVQTPSFSCATFSTTQALNTFNSH